jgi:tetratricopeptide (TPR) repeat protein
LSEPERTTANPRETESTTSSKSIQARPNTRRTVFLVLSVALLIYFVAQLPAEIARWHLAEAMESAEEGDYVRAISVSKEADNWSEMVETSLSRADWQLSLGNTEAAIEEVAIAGERDPGNWNTIFRRSTLLMDCEEPEMSADLIRESAKTYPVDNSFLQAQILNAEAYALAIARKDLNRALSLGEESLAILVAPTPPSDFEKLTQTITKQIWPDYQAPVAKPVRSAGVYDTVGYIYYLQGDFEAARADLDRAVAYRSLSYLSQRTQLAEAAKHGVEPDDLKPQVESVDHTLAVLYYHRGLVLKELGLLEDADQDFQRVKQLGVSPDDELF